MVISNAKEVRTIMEESEEGKEPTIHKEVREFEMLFVRGDTVTLISPMVKT